MLHNSIVAKKEIMHPMSSGVMHPVSSAINPFSSGVMHPTLSGNVYPMSSEITHPMFSGFMSPGFMHPVSHLLPSSILRPLPSQNALLLNSALSAPTTPLTAQTMLSSSSQISLYFHQPSTVSGQLCTPDGNLEQEKYNSKQFPRSEPFASLPTSLPILAQNPTNVMSSLSARLSVPDSMAITPCSSSAPGISKMFRPQPPSKNVSPIESVSHNRSSTLDVTPKRKSSKRLAGKSRRQQQPDNVGFAGAKFSESPQAKVVPLPPFTWCGESSSLSSCSGDEQFIPESVKVDITRNEMFHKTPTWNKCTPSVEVTSLHPVAVSSS